MLVLSACGAQASTPTTQSPSTFATPPPTGSASSSATPAAPPPPPLVLLQSDSGIAAVDASGRTQWTLTTHLLESELPGAGYGGMGMRPAGPNFLVLRADSSNPMGHLLVIDRTGKVIGHGTFPSAVDNNLFGSPAGTEWAYSVDYSPVGSTQAHHGRVIVGGVGERDHTLYSWVTPTPTCGACPSTEVIGGWTDMGIVMERWTFSGCGIGFHPDTASFLIDPATGALSDLFSNGQAYGDARHGVRAAYAVFRSPSIVYVNGTAYDEANTVADGIFVSPDGQHVGIDRFIQGGCGGTPSVKTELVTVASGATADISSCGIDAWLDSTHIVCSHFNDTKRIVEGIDGTVGPTLGSAFAVLVLPES